jgi:hypothetical protein
MKGVPNMYINSHWEMIGGRWGHNTTAGVVEDGHRSTGHPVRIPAARSSRWEQSFHGQSNCLALANRIWEVAVVGKLLFLILKTKARGNHKLRRWDVVGAVSRKPLTTHLTTVTMYTLPNRCLWCSGKRKGYGRNWRRHQRHSRRWWTIVNMYVLHVHGH